MIYKIILPTIIILSIFTGKILFDVGFFKTIHSHSMDHCESIQPVSGAEDFAYSKIFNILFVSSGYYPENYSGLMKQGNIFAILPSKNKLIKITPNLPFEFHPHGIALWENNSETEVYVINHRNQESTIEIFLYNGKKLIYIKTIRDPLLISPNDLVAINKRTFYISHDHGSHTEWGKKFEDFSRMGRGFISFYDGRVKPMYANLNFSNGIAISPDGKSLYVAVTLSRKILQFTRNPETNEVKYSNEIFLGTAPDNITVDEDGSLWIGAHPKVLDLKAHVLDHSKPSPSQVMHVTFINGAPNINEVFLDDGRKISAVSVAYPIGNTVYLGGIFDTKIYACPKPE